MVTHILRVRATQNGKIAILPLPSTDLLPLFSSPTNGVLCKVSDRLVRHRPNHYRRSTYDYVGYRSRQVPTAAEAWFAGDLGLKLPFEPRLLIMATADLRLSDWLRRRPATLVAATSRRVERH